MGAADRAWERRWGLLTVGGERCIVLKRMLACQLWHASCRLSGSWHATTMRSGTHQLPAACPPLWAEERGVN